MIRLADRLVLSLQEQVRAGSGEAAATAEAYRVLMREGLGRIESSERNGHGPKAASRAKTQADDPTEARERDRIKTPSQDRTRIRERDQSREQDAEPAAVQSRTREHSREQDQDRNRIQDRDQTRAQDPKGDAVRSRDQVRERSAVRSGPPETVTALVEEATNRHAAALRNAMQFASPESKRALQAALESCMAAQFRCGGLKRPGPGPGAGPGAGSDAGQGPGGPGGTGGVGGPRTGAPSTPPSGPGGGPRMNRP
jgi:hypothetical protein